MLIGTGWYWLVLAKMLIDSFLCIFRSSQVINLCHLAALYQLVEQSLGGGASFARVDAR